MKLNLMLAVALLAGFTLMNGCKDDDPPIVGITFETDVQEVLESDGTPESLNPDIEGIDQLGIEPVGQMVVVRLVFERALAGDVVLKIDIDGTARQTSSSSEVKDFEILEEGENLTVDDDEITIPNGTSEAALHIVVYEDLAFGIQHEEMDDVNDEGVPYETIQITLESVVSGPAKLGVEPLEHEITILEDDIVAYLAWEAADFEDNQAAAEVNMDVIFWFEELIWTAGAAPGTAFEVFSVPAGLGVGEVGLSYTYTSGNSDALNFEVGFFTSAGELEGASYPYEDEEAAPLFFLGEYKLVNKNAWSQSSPPKIAQTATKDGINYDDFSAIAQFEEGSRVRKSMIPKRLDAQTLQRLSQGKVRTALSRR